MQLQKRFISVVTVVLYNECSVLRTCEKRLVYELCGVPMFKAQKVHQTPT